MPLPPQLQFPSLNLSQILVSVHPPVVVFMVESFEARPSIPEVDEDNLDESTDSSINYDRLPSEFADQPLHEMRCKQSQSWQHMR